MGRFDDVAPAAEHGPEAPERTATCSRTNKRVLMVARSRVASSWQVVMGTLQES